MNKFKVKKMPLKKVEDTMALQRARVANRGEEKRSIDKIKIIQRAAALRCADVDREKTALKKFLEKVKKSTGYMNEDSHQPDTRRAKYHSK